LRIEANLVRVRVPIEKFEAPFDSLSLLDLDNSNLFDLVDLEKLILVQSF